MAQDADVMRGKVREAYSAIAERPGDAHVIPVGRALAENLGYPAELLDGLPPGAVERFAGVSNVSLFAELAPGSTVLDLGCGAGMDSLIAAERVGPDGLVIGVDFSPAMLERAQAAAAEARVEQVRFLQAESERLPLEDASIDTALVNGIFNLNPNRAAIFAELARVVRPGGTAYVAELLLASRLPEDIKASEAHWFA